MEAHYNLYNLANFHRTVWTSRQQHAAGYHQATALKPGWPGLDDRKIVRERRLQRNKYSAAAWETQSWNTPKKIRDFIIYMYVRIMHACRAKRHAGFYRQSKASGIGAQQLPPRAFSAHYLTPVRLLTWRAGGCNDTRTTGYFTC